LNPSENSRSHPNYFIRCSSLCPRLSRGGSRTGEGEDRPRAHPAEKKKQNGAVEKKMGDRLKRPGGKALWGRGKLRTRLCRMRLHRGHRRLNKQRMKKMEGALKFLRVQEAGDKGGKSGKEKMRTDSATTERPGGFKKQRLRVSWARGKRPQKKKEASKNIQGRNSLIGHLLR